MTLNKEKIGQAIALCRKRCGMTQKQLARKRGCHRELCAEKYHVCYAIGEVRKAKEPFGPIFLADGKVQW